MFVYYIIVYMLCCSKPGPLRLASESKKESPQQHIQQQHTGSKDNSNTYNTYTTTKLLVRNIFVSNVAKNLAKHSDP